MIDVRLRYQWNLAEGIFWNGTQNEIGRLSSHLISSHLRQIGVYLRFPHPQIMASRNLILGFVGIKIPNPY